METVTVELKHPKAISLLRELEALAVIKLVTAPKKTSAKKLSEVLRGRLSEKNAEALNAYVEKSRSEWERAI